MPHMSSMPFMPQMNFSEWKASVKELIDKAQEEPGYTISSVTKDALKAFRERADVLRSARQRKIFDREFAEFIAADDVLRGAIESRLRREIPMTVAVAAGALAEAQAFLDSRKSKNSDLVN
jgi:hypothetical protein